MSSYRAEPVLTRLTMPRITAPKIVMGAILLAGLGLTFFRFSRGLGASTNLSDQFPWGLWVGFDVLCGVALAAGGFTLTFLVYLTGGERFRPVVRPTVLTAFLGYLLVSVGLLFDLGKPWNIWHPLIFRNVHSVMFEVAWCVMLYTAVLAGEFSIVVFERLGWQTAKKVVQSVSVPLVLAGVLLSTLHQSSLGTLFLIVPGKLHPLWYSSIQPVHFFFSAVAVGFAMVIFESSMSSRFLGRSLEIGILRDLGRFLLVTLILYLAIRFQDMAGRKSFAYVFDGTFESWFFVAEILLFAVPVVLLALPRVRMSPRGLVASASFVVLAVVVNRLDIAIVGMMRASGVVYVPKWTEVGVTLSLLVGGVIAFWLAVLYLPIFAPEKRKGVQAAAAGKGIDRGAAWLPGKGAPAPQTRRVE